MKYNWQKGISIGNLDAQMNFYATAISVTAYFIILLLIASSFVYPLL